MEKEVITKEIKELTLKAINAILSIFYIFGLFTILAFHKIVSFFPVLFLFDFCGLFGYPLFLRYVLKRKWLECTKDMYLKIKYILLPYTMMELMVLLYYHKATFFIITTIMEDNGWK
ncbi:MAG: hypothetical protein J6N49_01540 [Alphaproteobacteria bacterium]|nr:hypothetical protein [Alphaproteobacteria bacterium]